MSNSKFEQNGEEVDLASLSGEKLVGQMHDAPYEGLKNYFFSAAHPCARFVVAIALLLLACVAQSSAAFAQWGPVFLHEIKDQTYTRHVTIPTLTLPTAGSGTGELTYTLRGELNGLIYDSNANAPTLSGTPAAAATTTALTFIATDSAPAPLSASLTFTVTVKDSLNICERSAGVRAGIVHALHNLRPAPERRASLIYDCSAVPLPDLASLTTLSLQRSSIRTLQAGDFSGLDGLKTLDLAFNELTALPDGVFAGLSELKVLQLRYNRLQTLSADIFAPLVELTYMSLHSNKLTRLPADAFEHLGTLKRLWLTANPLVTLPEGIFDSLGALVNLYLERNRLAELPDGVFDKLVNLRHLDLRRNRLTALPAGAFDKLDVLGRLRLDGAGNTLATLPVGLFDAVLDTLWILDVKDSPRFPLTAQARVEGAAERGVSEGRNHIVTVTLSQPMPFAVAVPFTAGFDGGISESDFTAPSENPNCAAVSGGSVLIASGESSANLSFCAVADSQIDEGESLVLTLGAPVAVDRDGVPAHQDVAPRLASLSTDPAHNRVTLLVIGPLEFIPATVGDLTHTVGIVRGPVMLPLAAGGEGEKTYALHGDLNGLVFDGKANPPTLSGSPLAVIPVTALTFTATDAAGVTVGLTFKVRVDGVGICARSAQVRDELIRAFPDLNCADFTSGDLEDIRGTLHLNYKSISTLQAGDFSGLVNLIDLRLAGNDLATLPEGVFDDLHALRRLVLIGNQLTELPEGVFNNLSALQELWLHDNQLPELPEGIFDNLAALQKLLLRDNQLTGLPEGIFDNQRALLRLELHDNQLAELPEGAFDNLPALQNLLLHNNRLTALPEGAFDNLPALQNLLLHNNRLTALPEGAFDNLNRLDILDLNDNQMTTLPENVFDDLRGVTELKLKNNRLNALPANVFDNLDSLRVLALGGAGNTLETLPPGLFDPLLDTLTELNIVGSPRFPLDVEFSLSGIEEHEVTRGYNYIAALAVSQSPLPFNVALSYDVAAFDGGAANFIGAAGAPGCTALEDGSVIIPAGEPGVELTFCTAGEIEAGQGAILALKGVSLQSPVLVDGNGTPFERDAFQNFGTSRFVAFTVGDSQGVVGRAPELSLPVVPSTKAFKRAGTFIGPYNLPLATGGIPPIHYTLTGDLNGLSFDGNSRPPVISGRMTNGGVTALTYTATDSAPPAGHSTSRIFNVSANRICERSAVMQDFLLRHQRHHWGKFKGDELDMEEECKEWKAEWFAVYEFLTLQNRSNLDVNNPGDSYFFRPQPGDFFGFKNVRGLYLQNNYVRFLPDGLFRGIPNTVELNLANNWLLWNNIGSDVFDDVPKLNLLDLSGNGLNAMDPALNGLSRLTRLHLQNNEIRRLYKDDFEGLGGLRELLLHNNRITLLRPDVFEHLTNLRRLNISGPLNARIKPSLDVFLPLLDTLTGLDVGANSHFPLMDPQVSVSGGANQMVDEGRNHVFTFSLSESVAPLSAKLPYTISVGAGVRSLDRDFRTHGKCAALEDGFVHFDAGQTSAELTFCTVGDATIQTDQSLTLAFDDAVGLVTEAGEPVHENVAPALVVVGFDDSFGDSDNSVELTVVDRLGFTVNGLRYRIYTAGTEITPLSFPVAHGGHGDLSYTLTGELAGLSFDANANPPVLRGTPEGSGSGNRVLTYRVTDSAVPPNSARLTLYMRVLFDPNAVGDQTFVAHTPITPIDLPLVRIGADDRNTHRLHGDLNGLVFDGSSEPPTLSGTPAKIAGPTPLTFVAAGVSLTFSVTVNGVCERTAGVRDGIVDELGLSDCTEMTAAALAGLERLNLQSRSISTLQISDFNDLPGLKHLYLSENNLTALPRGLFDKLSTLNTLDLSYNPLSTLPRGLFDNLDVLNALDLGHNNLTTLPVGLLNPILDELTYANFGGNPGFPPAVRVSVTGDLSRTIGKGHKHVVSVALSPALSPFNVAVPYGVALGGGASESDFTTAGEDPDCTAPMDGVVLIAAGERRAELTFCPIADVNAEGVETLTLSLRAAPVPVNDAGVAARAQVAANLASFTIDDLRNTVELSLVNVSLRFPRAVADQTSITGDIINITLPAAIGGTGDRAYALHGDLNGLVFDGEADPPTLSGVPASAADALLTFTATDSAATPEIAHLTFTVTVLLPGVCGRSTEVRAAILAGLNEIDVCNEVSAAALATITDLDLGSQSIRTLQARDFNGLEMLDALDLSGNELETLPARIFDGLRALTVLDLGDNRLTELPAGAFDDLDELVILSLRGAGNTLETLPKDLFDPLLDTLTGFDTTANPRFPLARPFGVTGATDRSANEGQRHIVSIALAPLPFAVMMPYRVIFGGGADESDFIAAADDPNCSSPESGSALVPAGESGFELTYCVAEDSDVESDESLTLILGDNPNPLDRRLHRLFPVASLLNIATGTARNSVRLRISATGMPPVLVPAVIADQAFNFGAAIRTLTLPMAADGDVIGLSYTLGGNLNGLVFDGNARPPTLSGTPQAVLPATALTFSATDAAGATVGLTFNMRVDGYGICTRSAPVRAAIIHEYGKRWRVGLDCAYFSAGNLKSIRSLYLGNKSISTLQAEDFFGLVNLTYVNLSGNDLTTLPEGVFDDQRALRRLELHDNQLTALPEGVFDNLPALQNLLLHGNQLAALPEGVFDNLPALQNLLLYGNQLTALPERVFDNLPALQDLSLYGNQLTALPEGAFDNLPALQNLLLHDNRLTALPEGIFDNLNRLGVLDLNDNQMTTLPENVFDDLRGVTELKLKNNRLNALPANVFDNLDSLRVLALGGAGNTLETLPPGLFDPLLDTLFEFNVVGSPRFPLDVQFSLSEIEEHEVTRGYNYIATVAVSQSLPFNVALSYGVTTFDGGAANFIAPASDPVCRALEDGSVIIPAGESSVNLTFCTPGRDHIEAGQGGILALKRVSLQSPLVVDGNGVPFRIDTPWLVAFTVGDLERVVGRAPELSLPVVPSTKAFKKAGTFIGPYNLPLATGGIPPIHYTLTGDLNGLSFDGNSRPPVISGRMTNGGVTALTYTATDSVNPPATASRIFNVSANRICERSEVMQEFLLRHQRHHWGKFKGDELDMEEECKEWKAEWFAVYEFLTLQGRTNLHANDPYRDAEYFRPQPGDFYGFRNLRGLYLQNNYMWSLPEGLFRGIPNTVELNLANNRLSWNRIGNGIFDDVPKLNLLILSDNALSELNPALNGLSRLTRLYLHNNSIRRLNKDDFEGLGGLRELLLHNNYIATLSPDVFEHLTNLRWLSLSGPSNIQEKPSMEVFLPLLGTLTRLDMGANPHFPLMDAEISVSGGANQMVDEGRNHVLTFSLSESTPISVRVPYTVSLSDGASGRFRASEDHPNCAAPEGGFVQFDQGRTRVELTFCTVDNSDVQSDQSLTLTFGDTPVLVTETGEPVHENVAPVLAAISFDDSHNSVELTVVDRLSLYPNELGNRIYTVGTAITPLSLPVARGGRGDLSYTLTGEPAGLSFDANANPPVLRGTPEGSGAGSHLLTFSVTDPSVSPNSVSLTFLVRIDFDSNAVGDQTFLAHTPITPINLPAVRVGAGDGNTHTLHGDLNGLVFDGSSEPPTLSGTPAKIAGPTPLTFVVTGNSGVGMSFTFTVTVNGVCERTAGVRDGIVDELGLGDCSEVTAAALDGLERLNLQSRSISALQVGDFNDLPGLKHLYLFDNDLALLPSRVFDGLAELTVLDLSENDLPALPADIFNSLRKLSTLSLVNNRLAELPAEVFDNLDALNTLDLGHNALTTLPRDLFDNLDVLSALDLSHNDLTTLPAGLLNPLLDELTFADFGGNPNFPLAGRISVTGDLSRIIDKGRKHVVSVALSPALSPFNVAVPYGVVLGGGATESDFTVAGDDPDCAAPADGVVLITAGESGAELTFCHAADAVGDGAKTLTLSLRAAPAPANDAGVAARAQVAANLASLTIDDLRNTVELSFVDVSLRFPRAVADQTFATGDIVNLTLPAADGGIGEKRYSLDGVPPGLGLILDIGADGIPMLLGMPITPVSETPLILTATDSGDSPSTVSLTFNLTVNTAPLALVPDAVAEQTFFTNAAITTLTLPSALGGVGNKSYTLHGSLNGLVFEVNGGTPTLSGTPLEAAAATPLTFIATDAAGVPVSAALTFNITVDGICERTAEVRAGILTALGGDDCAAVSAAGLGSITELDLTSYSIGSLRAGDFAGLDMLTALHLGDNDLAALPPHVFDRLAALTVLDLSGNDLPRLPADIFDGLGELDRLYLGGNELTTLSADIFNNLRKLSTLSLANNRLAALPAGLFNNLDALLILRLGGAGNTFATLPTGLFVPLFDTLVNFDTTDSPAFPLEGTQAGIAGDAARVVSEGESHTVTIRLSPALTHFAVALSYTVTLGDGASVSDFTAPADNPNCAAPENGSITIAAGETNAELTFCSANDGVIEIAESLTFILGAPVPVDNSGVRARADFPVSDVAVLGTDTERNSVILRVADLPVLSPATVGEQSYTADAAITTLSLPVAAGGSGNLSYTLGGVPAGLSFDGGTEPPTLSGAPQGIAEGDHELTYTVQDIATTRDDTLTFAIHISPALLLGPQDLSYTADFPLDALTIGVVLAQAVGGAAPLSYRLTDRNGGGTSGAVPPGLAFDEASRELRGIPTTAGVYTPVYAVIDNNDVEVLPAFTITISAPIVFANDGNVAEGSHYTLDSQTAIALTLPSASGGTLGAGAILTGVLDPDVAGGGNFTGLNFDAASRVLSGTLTGVGGELKWKVSDDTGAFIERRFTLVTGGPYFVLADQVADRVWRQSDAIEALTLPQARAANPVLTGATPITYALAGAAALGLIYDGDTRVLKGVPTMIADSAVLTYTATDSQAAPLSATMLIQVKVLPELTFHAHQIQESRNYDLNEVIALALPQATGGEGVISYDLRGEESHGWLTYSGDSGTPGVLSGAIESRGQGALLTYTAMDTATATAAKTIHLIFRITSSGPVFAGATEAQVWRQSETIAPLTLSEATPGNPSATGATPIHYQLDGAPAGLIFTANTRVLSGAPSAVGATEMTYTAADSQSPPVMSQQVIAVTVLPELTFHAHGIQASRNYAPGEAVALTLPWAEGGEGAISYDLSGEESLAWLAYTEESDPASAGYAGILSGAVESRGQSATLTFTATDTPSAADAKTIRLTFVITSDGPVFAGATEEQVWRQSKAIVSLTLSEAVPSDSNVAGATPIRYQLDGVPAGLDFDENTRVLSGAPSTVGATEMTYIATDSQSPPVASQQLIVGTVLPELRFHAHQIQESRDYDINEVIALTLPQAAGGEGVISYDLRGEELHGWLAYNGDSGTPGVLSGAIESRGQSATLTFTATDTPATAATAAKTIRLIFRITSSGPVFAGATEAQVWRQSETIAPLTLPEATPGNPSATGATPIHYQLDGVPAGLNFNRSTRVLSGAPGTVVSSTEMTYTATDSQSSPVISQQLIAVTVLPELIFHAHQIQLSQNYAFAETFALILPQAAGGEGAISYDLRGEESHGWLAYSGDSGTPGVLSGTIESRGQNALLTFSATDTPATAATVAKTIRLIFRITSSGPVFAGATEAQVWRQSETIAPLTLPEATPGDSSVAGATPIRYRLDSVPAGLNFNRSTRVLSGAPDAAVIRTEMTYTAIDSQSPPMTSQQLIAVTVLPELRFHAHQVQASQNYAFAETFALVLPEVVGGEGAISYDLSGEESHGWLTYSGNSGTPGVLSGTIESPGQRALLRFTATDTPVTAGAAAKTIGLIFQITSSGPVFAGATEALVFRQSETIAPLILSEAAPGDPDVAGARPMTYQLDSVPAGLNFNRSTRVLSGTPGTAVSTEMTYTATDSQNPPVTSQQLIAVTVLPELRFHAHQIQSNQNYAFAEEFSLILPQAAGGEGAISYDLRGEELHSWLTYSGDSGAPGVLSGAIVSPGQSALLTFTATDTPPSVSAKAIQLRFRIGSDGPYFHEDIDGDEIADRVHIHRSAQAHEDDGAAGYPLLPAAALPAATRNPLTVTEAGPLTYRVVDAAGNFVQGSAGASTPYAMPGLRFDPDRRVLSGAPQRVGVEELTYRVNDANGGIADLYFSVRVVTPRYFRYALGEVIAAQDVVLRTVNPVDGLEEEGLRLPESDGGVPGVVKRLTDDAGRSVAGSHEAVAPYAAPGLTFSPDLGVLRGIPTEAGETSLVYSVEDPLAPQIRLEFRLSVVEAPVFIKPLPDIGYIEEEDAIDMTLPEAYGTAGEVTYYLTTDSAGLNNNLPPGLTFDSDKRHLFGTPLTAVPFVAGARAARVAVRALSSDLVYIASARSGDARQRFKLFTKSKGQNKAPSFNANHVGYIELPLGPENTSIRFDPSPYFTDPNSDDRHIYSAVSGDQDIVRVSHSPSDPGGRMTLTLRAAGESTDLTVTATDPHGAVDTGILRITIRGTDIAGEYEAANRKLLPTIARAIADQNVSAIVRRIRQAAANRRDFATHSLAGESDPERIAAVQARALAEDRFDFKDILTRSSFVMPMSRNLDGAGAAVLPATGKNTVALDVLPVLPGLSLGIPYKEGSAGDGKRQGLGETLVFWGSGDQRKLSGDDFGVISNWDADVYGAHFGADFLVRPDILAGISVSWNRSEMDYTGDNITSSGSISGSVDGEHELKLVTVSPYLAWGAGSFDLWAVVGYGKGNLDVVEVGEAGGAGDAEMRTMAVGAVSPLSESHGGFVFRFKGEAQKAALKIKDTGKGAAAVEVDTSRIRATIEASRPDTFLNPRLEAGLRLDGGDSGSDDDGGGVLELGLSVDHSNSGGGLRTTGRVYTLIGKDDYSEWGIQGHITLTPANTRGLSLSLSPGYGTTRDGLEQIWRERTDVSDISDAAPSLKTRFSYAISRGRTVLTPHTEFSFGDHEKIWSTGLSWDSERLFNLTLTGERRRDDAGEDASNSVLLQGKLHF